MTTRDDLTGTSWECPDGVASGPVARPMSRGVDPVAVDPAGLHLEFSGELWHWRGPAPWYFVTVPEEESFDLQMVATEVSYGWGMIPVTAQVGDTRWETSLFPKDDLYVVPVKAAVRRAEGLDEGDLVTVRLTTGDSTH